MSVKHSKWDLDHMKMSFCFYLLLPIIIWHRSHLQTTTRSLNQKTLFSMYKFSGLSQITRFFWDHKFLCSTAIKLLFWAFLGTLCGHHSLSGLLLQFSLIPWVLSQTRNTESGPLTQSRALGHILEIVFNYTPLILSNTPQLTVHRAFNTH